MALRHKPTPYSDWKFLQSSSALIAEAPSRQRAELYVNLYLFDLARVAFAAEKDYFLVRYPECKTGFKVPARLSRSDHSNKKNKGVSNMAPSPQDRHRVAVPGIQFGGSIHVDPVLFNVLGEFLEYPERKGGLVRLADQRQIALCDSFSDVISMTLEEAAQLQREDYWWLPDLADFNRDSVRALEANNPQSIFEFTFLETNKDPEVSRWRRVTNRYRLIQDTMGAFYHIGDYVGSEEVLRPAIAIR